MVLTTIRTINETLPAAVPTRHAKPYPPPSKDFTGPVNLGNPVEMTVAVLAEKIIELSGSSSKIT